VTAARGGSAFALALLFAAACQRSNPAFEGALDGEAGAGGRNDAAGEGQGGQGGKGGDGGGMGGGGSGSDGAQADAEPADHPADAPVDKPGDLPKELPPDLPPDLPKEMPPPATPGCLDGTREGFLDVAKWPNVAACGGSAGAKASYGVTTASASSLCAEGWHWCHAAEIAPLGTTLPTFTTSGSIPCAWLSDTTEGCGNWKFFENPSCDGGAKLVTPLEGFGDCHFASSCTGGFRPIVRLDKWNDVTAFVADACQPHLTFACGGLEGGDLPPSNCWIACCKD